ncbi:endo alpha-1,4 polygalactosaminidase [Streptodolium elevatio]
MVTRRGGRGVRGPVAVGAALAVLLVAGCGSGSGSGADARASAAVSDGSAASPEAPAPLSPATGSDGTASSTSAPPAVPAPAASSTTGAPGAPGAATTAPPPAPAPPAPGTPAPPPAARPGAAPAANTPFDYQIGGPYQPKAGVGVVVRDRGAAPLGGAYNVCYVNTFQAQPDATAWWEKQHPDLLLRDGGAVVMDEDWGEALLDVSTPAKRDALIAVVGPWIDDCARRGFQAVEADNLDSFGRSHGKLTLAHNAAFAKLLAARAHTAGLAFAQKNTVEMVGQRASVGFDFVVSEECAKYDECGAFAAAYDNKVFVVEYARADFDTACRGFAGRLSIVLRDRDVTAPGQPGHVYAAC